MAGQTRRVLECKSMPQASWATLRRLSREWQYAMRGAKTSKIETQSHSSQGQKKKKGCTMYGARCTMPDARSSKVPVPDLE